MGLEVTAFTSNPEKIEAIKELGAHEVVLVDKEYKALEKFSDKFDVLLNTLTVSDSERINQYFNMLKFKGKLVQVGVPPMDTMLSFDIYKLLDKNLKVVGSDLGSIADTIAVMDFCVEHNIKIMSEMYDFADFPKALARVEKEVPLFKCVVAAEEY